MKKVIVEIYAIYGDYRESPSLTERFVAEDGYEFRKSLIESEDLDEGNEIDVKNFLQEKRNFIEKYNSGAWDEPTTFGIQIMTYEEYKERMKAQIEAIERDFQEVSEMMKDESFSF